MVTRAPPPPDAGPDTFAAAAGTPAAPNPFAAASADNVNANPAKPTLLRRLRRLWRTSAAVLISLCALVLLLAALGWWWAGQNTSLASALAQVARWLPADQQLQSSGVSGTLRSGGQLGWLRWSSPSLSVEVRDAQIRWSLAALLQRKLQLGQVHAASVRITATPQPDAPRTEPLEQLVLPVHIDLPFEVDLVEWAGPAPVQARALSGNYRYDRIQHHLDIHGVDWAEGHYSAQATLQAQAPMALQATLEGQVRATTPGTAQPLHLSAHATLSGTLATAAAQLQLQAQVRPAPRAEAPAGAADTHTNTATQPPANAGKRSRTRTRTSTPARRAAATPAQPVPVPVPPPPAQAMHADISAVLLPWAEQPLQQASADLRALNLAALWPQAPATALHGSVQAGPQAGGWQLAAQVRNDLPGPWDAQRLPISALDAQADFDGAQWRIPQATVQVGTGQITLQGAYHPAHSTVQGSAQAKQLVPAALHSQLGTAPLSGPLSAQTEGTAVRFSVQLQAARGAAKATSGKTAPLLIHKVQAQGQWQAPQLTLQSVEIDALQAQLRGQKIEATLGSTPGARGTLALTVPGASINASGQLDARNGAGRLQVNVAAAEQLLAWLQTLPGMAAAAPQGTALQGKAQLDARWQGGWHSLQQQLQAATGSGTAQAMATAPAATSATAQSTPLTPFTVQATLEAPQLSLTLPAPTESAAATATAAPAPAPTTPTATRVQLRTLRAVLSGTLAKATLSLDGQATVAEHSATLQTQINAGLDTANTQATQWRAHISSLQLALHNTQQPTPWTLQLAQPLALTLRQMHSGTVRHTLEAAAGQARITAPAPGTAVLRWQPLRLDASAAGAVQLQTKGEFTGLPMAWADALAGAAQATLAERGLAGDLVLDGRWDLAATDTLRATASVQRASGDLRVLTGEPATVTTMRSSAAQPQARASSNAPGTAAGVRHATLQITAQGEQVQARLLWDTERAGHIEADASTRLTRQDGGWTWAADAPLAARIRARMPDLGVWSVLAPPGWRIGGTLDADASLSGDRSAPRWQGTLGADQLALRSVVDGVDLQEGRLRAALRGERLDITELSLRGGPGSRARIAGYSGNRTAAPTSGGSLQGSGSITWGSAAPGAAQGTGTSSGSGIGIDFSAQASALQVLVRADRQVSVSGNLSAGLRQGQITLRGKLTTDRATIILPDASAPRLGDDVVVRSAAIDQANAEKAQRASQTAARAQTAQPPDIAITLNLGEDFALQGHGITTRLSGELDIRSSTVVGAPPRVTGEITTVQGRYRAWGQVLDVETGLVRFNGPYDNPALDILALRPNISVRAGVQINGSAQAPRVRLYASPDLPDAEKLSWVVAGRSTAAGGAEAALLQQAALSLLGRSQGNGTEGVAQRLGLDEIGFKGPEAGNSASTAAITLGKRFSRDLYVTYEHGLSGTLGAIYIFYDLSRRLTLRGQTGTQSAVDIIYTVRHD